MSLQPSPAPLSEKQPGKSGDRQHVTDSSTAVLDQVDVFVEHEDHTIHYKTLSWQAVALLMIAEIVSNGMLSLPSALAAVGIVPAIILIVFLGVFALYTAKLLIDFKYNHPGVHTMGDAGFIMWGHLGREVLFIGAVMFAIAGTGSELLSGQLALSTLSSNGLCVMLITLIFSTATFLLSLPRTIDGFRWLGLISALSITLAGILAMVGAARNPVSGRTLSVTLPTDFYHAFLAITNPVFAYAVAENTQLMLNSLLRFFVLISEMRRPEDAMKAAICLQVFATIFYAVFSIVIYAYVGNNVASPALFSLPPIWSKITFAVALPNFLITGGLYAHTAAKLIFIRIFRHSVHVYRNTALGWFIWFILCFAAVAIAFLLAIAVPIFTYLIGVTAALFASWYTYGLAGFFYLHDTYQLKGRAELRQRYIATSVAILTILMGAFICVAGTYVSIKLIAEAYEEGLVGRPFTC